MPYATKDDVQVIVDALTVFNPNFDVKYCTKSQLSKMPTIQRFLTCPEHCHMNSFTYELRMCGVDACTLCVRINRDICTPDVEVDGHNLREEVL